jgi:hypothetical protein
VTYTGKEDGAAPLHKSHVMLMLSQLMEWSQLVGKLVSYLTAGVQLCFAVVRSW